VEVGYGVSRVGRGPDQRIILDFGDAEISRDRAAEIAYDPKTRRFVLIRGTSTNLIYHNDTAVYQPTDLSDGDLIQIGNTTLRFVPLCGPSFSWEAIS
jgi:pSer/pThr/pTyr-binding forkhead associated (FHA) protein